MINKFIINLEGLKKTIENENCKKLEEIIKTAQNLDSLSAGKMGMGTTDVGDMVKDFILANGEWKNLSAKSNSK